MTKTDLNHLSAVEIMGWTLYPESVQFVGEYGVPHKTAAYYSFKRESKVDGAILVSDWTPLTDMNQIMQVVKRMIELGWSIEIYIGATGSIDVTLMSIKIPGPLKVIKKTYSCSLNEAIITTALIAKGVLEVGK